MFRGLGDIKNKQSFMKPFSILLVIVSLSLYIFSIFITRVSVLQEANFLAMLKTYPLTYWFSIFFILFALCISKEKMIYLELSLLYIFLINTPYFVESNIREGSAYWPLGMADQITQTGSLPTIGGPYVFFPGYICFASMVSQTLSLPLDLILKVLSVVMNLTLLWNVFIMNRFLFPNTSSRLIVFPMLLFIAGSWTNVMYFHPMSMAFLIFISILNIALKRQFIGLSHCRYILIIIVLGYFSIVITHMLVPLFIASFLVLYFSTSRMLEGRSRKIAPICLFLTIFFTWLVFQAYPFFRAYLKKETAYLADLPRLYGGVTSGRGPFIGSTDYLIVFWTRVGLMLILIGLSSIGILKIFRQKEGKTISKGNTTLILSYISGAVSLILIPYGGEIFTRTFYFLLPILVFLAALALRGHQRTATVLILLLLIMQPIAYVGDESTILVSDYVIGGASFFQKHFAPNVKYIGPAPLIFYFDTYGPPNYKNYYSVGEHRFNQTYIAELAKSDWNYYCDYQTIRNYYAWFLGFDLSDMFINSTLLNRLYDGGGFKIFGKT